MRAETKVLKFRKEQNRSHKSLDRKRDLNRKRNRQAKLEIVTEIFEDTYVGAEASSVY